jgi:hypothetical protein
MAGTLRGTSTALRRRLRHANSVAARVSAWRMAGTLRGSVHRLTAAATLRELRSRARERVEDGGYAAGERPPPYGGGYAI